MKVMKFGGTSVGSPERMKSVCQLVTKSGEPTFIVLSAMSGTTNSLVEISDYLYHKNPEGANEVINRLEEKYLSHVEELYSTDEYKVKTREFILGEFAYLRSFTKELFTSFEEKSIIAQGEIMSTNMVVNYLQEQGINAILLSALDFMRTDKNAEPDPNYIKEKLTKVLEENEGYQIYITKPAMVASYNYVWLVLVAAQINGYTCIHKVTILILSNINHSQTTLRHDGVMAVIDFTISWVDKTKLLALTEIVDNHRF